MTPNKEDYLKRIYERSQAPGKMTNKEIADALYLSAHTVITHRRNIARKLQIHSPAGLTIYAIVNKLVELQDIKKYL